MQSLTPKSAGGIGSVKLEPLAAAGFFEIVFPIKYAFCTANEGLHSLLSSDVMRFHQFWEEPESKAMKPVILVALVISKSHLDKTVLSLGVGAHVKGEHTLPEWVKESAKRSEAEPGSVAEMIAN